MLPSGPATVLASSHGGSPNNALAADRGARCGGRIVVESPSRAAAAEARPVGRTSLRMKITILIIFAVALMSVVVFVACAQRARQASADEVTRGLRTLALTLSPKDLGLQTVAHKPYTVIMDIAYPKATASVMSSATGDASIYISTGGGVLGGVGHETVRKAAKAFVEESAKYTATFQATSDFPYPKPGSVRFFLTTPEGVLVSQEIPEAELASGNHPLSKLFFAGQEVITQLRESTPGFN